MKFFENQKEKNETPFQIGQEVIWKTEVIENPGLNIKTKKIDFQHKSKVLLIDSFMPAKIMKIEGADIFLDVPGCQNFPVNYESLILAE